MFNISNILSIYFGDDYLKRKALDSAVAKLPGYVTYIDVVRGKGFFGSDRTETRAEKMAKIGFPFMVEGNIDTVFRFDESDRVCQKWTYTGSEFYFTDENDALYFKMLN